MVNQSDEFCMCIPATTKKRVIVIGGGFGGMNLVKFLSEDFQVILIDKNNYHTFIPLLYQVATAGIEPDSIADPLRNLVEQGKDVHFRMVKVTGINPEKKEIQTSIDSIPYDYLVIATGSETNYFGNKSIQKYGLPLKSLRNALNMRSKFLESFERATFTRSEEEKSTLLNFVIVGGGPTGVELAGTLSEMRKHVLPKDYPELDIANMSIYLVHSHDTLLPGMSAEAGKRTYKYLKDMGIDMILNDKVVQYDGETVTLKSGGTLKAGTLVWGAGVRGSSIEGLSVDSVVKGSYKVDEFNRVFGYDDIFAIGDVALQVSKKYPEGHPGVAQVAIQQGRHLAHNLMALNKGERMEPFVYKNKGTIATVGRNKAVGDLAGNIKTGGWFAWISWWVVHIYYLVGFRNKLGTFINWILNYFFYKYSSRLIVKPYIPNDNENDVEESILSREMIDESAQDNEKESSSVKNEV